MLVAVLGLSLCESGLEASEDGDVDGMGVVLVGRTESGESHEIMTGFT